MVEKNRLLGGIAAAIVVCLWGVPRLVGVLLAEPPPTQRSAIKAVLNASASMALGGLLGVLSFNWVADFLNAVVEKLVGVNPHVDPVVASVVLAVLVTGLGPALLDRFEKVLGKKLDEVTP